MTSNSEAPDWSYLPSDLLISIALKLGVADIARLRVVCTSWAWSLGLERSGWPKTVRYRASFVPIAPSVPWMLLPNENGQDADFCSFLDLSDRQVRRISPLPEMVGRRCIGASPDGWLVTLDFELNPRVLNPLTREELSLPSLFTLFPYPANVRFHYDESDGSLIGLFEKGARIRRLWYHPKEIFCDAYVLKIVLTSAPPSGVAVVFFGSDLLRIQLAFSRIGDASWTPVPISRELNLQSNIIMDVMYDKENHRLYAVTWRGGVMFFDLHVSDWLSGLQASPAPLPMKPTSIAYLQRPIDDIDGNFVHLIFLSDRFLQIRRIVEESFPRSVLAWHDRYNRLQRLMGWMAPVSDEESEEDGDGIEFEDGEENWDLFDDGESVDEGSFDGDDSDFWRIVKTETEGIDILKFDPMKKQSGWSQANASDLDNQAIFVGSNHIFSLPVAGRPGLKKNSIYFTETYLYDNLEWRRNIRDAGVYDVETGSFERFFSSHSQVNWPPPLWFMPSQLHFEFLS